MYQKEIKWQGYYIGKRLGWMRRVVALGASRYVYYCEFSRPVVEREPYYSGCYLTAFAQWAEREATPHEVELILGLCDA